MSGCHVSADGPFVVLCMNGTLCIAASQIERIEVRHFMRCTDTLEPNEHHWAVNVYVIGRANTAWNPSFAAEGEAERIAAMIRRAALEAGMWRRG